MENYNSNLKILEINLVKVTLKIKVERVTELILNFRNLVNVGLSKY